jgi:hypothetical protein
MPKLSDIERIVHATMLASNIVLRRRGARVDLVPNEDSKTDLTLRRKVRYDALDVLSPILQPGKLAKTCPNVSERAYVPHIASPGGYGDSSRGAGDRGCS